MRERGRERVRETEREGVSEREREGEREREREREREAHWRLFRTTIIDPLSECPRPAP